MLEQVEVGEFESALIALNSAVRLNHSLQQTAQATGMHWEDKWGEVVGKLESRGAVTYLTRRVN